MNQRTDVTVNPDGSVSIVFHPGADGLARELAAVGAAAPRRRGGYVLPKNICKRLAFSWLRRTFGSAGRVAEWTRGWPGPWVVEMVDTGAVLGDFPTHQAAVEAEIREIETLLKTKGA